MTSDYPRILEGADVVYRRDWSRPRVRWQGEYLSDDHYWREIVEKREVLDDHGNCVRLKESARYVVDFGPRRPGLDRIINEFDQNFGHLDLSDPAMQKMKAEPAGASGSESA